MPNSKKILAIAETSYIIRKGLVYALSQLPTVAKVVELKEHENISYQVDILAPDALIINPMLLGHSFKQDVRQQLKVSKDTSVIALVYNLIDEQFYRSYDDVIRINDSESKIEEALDKCFKESKTAPDQEELSDREKDILIGVVKGMSNKEIADFHNISIHTVITHRRNIGRKLGIHSASGLTVYAIINKFVDIKDISL
ncbi:helix-turn-helix transcriptional regulator [Viscerimonas tarda]